MPDDPDWRREPAEEDADLRRRRLALLAGRLGVGLPPFDAPLVVFEPAGGRRPGGPVYLGGDLHAVHRGVTPSEVRESRDETLDDATVTLTVGDPGDLVETVAISGIWCVALHDEMPDTSSSFLLRDGELRTRARLLLPPARAMLGRGHLWLPSVPAMPPHP